MFRAAEQLHTTVVSASVIQRQGNALSSVHYDVQAMDLPVLEDKVAAGSEDSTMDRIPPLVLFRGDLKRCCESMQVALASYLVPGEAQGQFSEEQPEWLLSKGFKIIVDLQEEDVKNDLYLSAVQEAVVNIPVEIGTAHSAEQVQRFAEIVFDSAKKPIYLHSQEGNGRTSVKVSRWKQHVTCAERLATQNGSLNGNGKPVKNDQTEQLTNSPVFSSEGSKNSTLL
uniref:DSP-PTPase phosphatase fused to NAD+ Kinase domain-containing protein n=1 Tax=Oryza punctata TaxID=4537 RepID=A0A0E0MD95_ORYPU